MNRAVLIAAIVAGAAMLYFAIPMIWYVVPNHFPAPVGIW